MPFDRAAARRDGYSDAQIDAFIRSDPTFAAEADATRRVANNGGDFVHSVARGASFNMTDRLDGLSAMAETAINNLGPNKVAYSPQQAYEAVVRANQARAAQYAQEHPGRDLAGTMIGGLMMPGSSGIGNAAVRGVGEAATLGQKAMVAARSGVVGGLTGAAYGAGGADPGQMLPGAAKGAVSGFALGAVTPGTVAGLERGVKYAGRMGANAVAAAARAYPKGGSGAGTRVAGAVERVASKALTDPELRAASAMQAAVERDAAAGIQLDPNVAPMFGQGKALQGAYDVLAQYPGPSQTIIDRAAKATREATHDGLKADLGTHMSGTGNYWAKLGSILETRADNAKKVMDKIGQNLVTLNSNSLEALRAERATGALKNVVLNDLADEDPVVRASAANLQKLIDENFGGKGTMTATVQQAQDISEGLLKAADAAYKDNNHGLGKALKGLGRSVRNNARNPDLGGHAEYDQFLKQYVTDSEAKRAYDLGSQVFNEDIKFSPEKVQMELSKMGDGAWDHYRKGVGESMFHRVGRANGDTQVIRNLVKGDNFRDRVAMAFRSPADFEDFLATAEQRLHATELSNRYIHGSPTFARQEAAKAMNDAGADVRGDMAEGIVNPAGLSAKAIRALIKGGGDKTLLTALGNPRANAAMGRTATDPAELQALLTRLSDYRRLNAAPKLGGRAAVVAGSAQANRRP